jgi:hypothetical protein
MEQPVVSPSPKNKGLGLILRSCWMIWGYLPLMYSAKMIVYGGAKIPSLTDLGVLANLLFIIVVRYFDIRYCDGMTADGAPATMADLRSFSLKAAGFFLFFWAMVHFIAY